ncbi:hypothetical protein CHS0354_032853 [Potamilus streckersoni]|uniref:Ubiquitin-like domain-containing protein n=1 Tax=Potamilus streckersoni TaxID=2493646 RepID=A0AAE0S957_9BIVA|nr:hypothetical protein CHS0354_032853 [Potamilus streckersoni]
MSAPNNGQSRPNNGQSRLNNGQSRPNNGQSRLNNGQSRLNNGQSRPKNGQSRLNNGQSRPRNGQSKPNNGQSRLNNGQSRPKNGQSRLNNGQSRLNNGQSRPRNGQSKPNNGQSRLNNGQSRPKNGQSRTIFFAPLSTCILGLHGRIQLTYQLRTAVFTLTYFDISMASARPDSESDDEFQNRKNTQSKRTVRGICRHGKKSSADVNNPDIVYKAQMYSTQVMRCFDNLETNKEFILAAAETSDVEDDIGALYVKTKKGKDFAEDSEVDKLLYISDDEDQVKYSTPEKKGSSVVLVESPSPPALSRRKSPSPRKSSHYDFSKCSGKGAVGVKRAIKHLTKAQRHLQEEEERNKYQTPDPDVTVLEAYDGDITVRIQLKSEMHRFVMKRWQPFSHIMKQLTEQEGVPESHIMLVHKDKTLDESDTPNSVKLHTADIIECHIISRFEEGDSPELNNSLGIENPDLIELCVQSCNRRNKVFIKVDKRKTMDKLMKLYADRVNVDSSKLKFFFDGEEMDITQTPESMDIENGDCIDVIVAR